MPPFAGSPIDAAVTGTKPAFGFLRFETGQGGLDPVSLSPIAHVTRFTQAILPELVLP